MRVDIDDWDVAAGLVVVGALTVFGGACYGVYSFIAWVLQ